MFNSRFGNLFFVVLFSIFCIVETLCFTYFKKLPLFAEANALIYFICGVLISVGTLFFTCNTAPDNTKNKENVFLWPQVILASAVVIFCGILYYKFGLAAYTRVPISYKGADMLPLIGRACNRFLLGLDVYANPINEPGFWPNSYIPYLPAMWLPFLPATISSIDIRWTTLAASLIGYILLLIFVVKLPLKKAVIAFPVYFTLFFLLTKFFTWEDPDNYFILTQEAVPGLIYLLLFIALMLNKDWFIAIMLALCTLSRYSVVLFIPVYVLWLLLDKNYRSLWRFVMIYTGIILCLFVFPFFLKRPAYFLNITAGYQKFEQGFWFGHIDGHIPKGNLGLAYFIGYDVPVLSMLKLTTLALTGLVSAAWLFAYHRYRSNIAANKNIWLMAGFKLALVLFYNFISMPYQYLFIVPTIVSYPLLLAVINRTNFKAIKQT